MRGDVSGVGKRGTDLVGTQSVLGGNTLGRFTGRQRSNDRGDVDARAGQTRLPESHVGIHRDAWQDFHCANANTGARADRRPWRRAAEIHNHVDGIRTRPNSHIPLKTLTLLRFDRASLPGWARRQRKPNAQLLVASGVELGWKEWLAIRDEFRNWLVSGL